MPSSRSKRPPKGVQGEKQADKSIPAAPLDPDGLCDWLMANADKHAQNGVLTVNELRTFLPEHPFQTWLTKQHGQWLRYDLDRDGGISVDELQQACADYCAEQVAKPQKQPVEPPGQVADKPSTKPIVETPAQVPNIVAQIRSEISDFLPTSTKDGANNDATQNNREMPTPATMPPLLVCEESVQKHENGSDTRPTEPKDAFAQAEQVMLQNLREPGTVNTAPESDPSLLETSERLMLEKLRGQLPPAPQQAFCPNLVLVGGTLDSLNMTGPLCICMMLFSL